MRSTAATCRRRGVIEGTAVRAQPVSFDDHFSQATMFYRSLSPIEQAHVVEAFTFELGKVYEQAIKERELQVLANVDADLCAQVAAGLGLPAPKGKPAEDVTVSPALVQLAGRARAGSPAARSGSSPTPDPTWPASPSW